MAVNFNRYNVAEKTCDVFAACAMGALITACALKTFPGFGQTALSYVRRVGSPSLSSLVKSVVGYLGAKHVVEIALVTHVALQVIALPFKAQVIKNKLFQKTNVRSSIVNQEKKEQIRGKHKNKMAGIVFLTGTSMLVNSTLALLHYAGGISTNGALIASLGQKFFAFYFLDVSKAPKRVRDISLSACTLIALLRYVPLPNSFGFMTRFATQEKIVLVMSSLAAASGADYIFRRDVDYVQFEVTSLVSLIATTLLLVQRVPLPGSLASITKYAQNPLVTKGVAGFILPVAIKKINLQHRAEEKDSKGDLYLNALLESDTSFYLAFWAASIVALHLRGDISL